MTYAICIKCGEGKHGALTPCMKCGFTPESHSDQARAIMLCDHSLDRAQLDQVGAQIKSGNPVEFDEETVAETAAQFEQFAKNAPSMRGCRVVFRILIATIFILIAAIIYLSWFR